MWSFGDGDTSAAQNPTHTYTNPGDYTVSLTVSDACGSDSQARTGYITVDAAPLTLEITTTGLPEAKDGVFYYRRVLADGGIDPYTWSISSGNLPQGLSLSSDGIISGTPQEQGVFDLTLQVMDGTSQTATKELSLSVRQAQGWEMAVGTPTSNWLRSVSMVSATDGWAVGDEGTILHYDGTSRSAVSSPTSSDLGSVSMVSATDGWAVGFWGTILHYDGTSWSELSSLTSNLLLSVSMVSATDGWAVGTGSTILRFVGTPPLAPPSDLTAKATFSTQTNLSWQDNSDNEEGFKIERKMAGGVWKEIAIVETNVINYSDSSGLAPNTTCSYRVKAYNAKGDSDYSNETSVTTPDLSRNLEGVVVYPNPFRPGRGDTSIKFANMTSNVAIRIYNVTGELIRQEENINTGAWEWDGKNDSGQVVATDCYIYIIMNDNGEKTGKICVIR